MRFSSYLVEAEMAGDLRHKPSDYSNTSSDIDHTVGYESQPSEHR